MKKNRSFLKSTQIASCFSPFCSQNKFKSLKRLKSGFFAGNSEAENFFVRSVQSRKKKKIRHESVS